MTRHACALRKYGAKKEMKSQTQYHTTPIAAMANTLAAILEVKDIVGMDELTEVVRYAYEGEAQHVVLFCPSAVGTSVLAHYDEVADKIKRIAPLRQDFVAPYPADSATSYASMFVGVTVDDKNKQAFEHAFDDKGEPIRSLFTECKGKRNAVVLLNEKNPCRTLWRDTGAEVVTARSDMDVVTKAVEYIRKDCYDLIVVMVNEFDEMLHAVQLYGKRCDSAIQNHQTEFELLADAASVYMRGNTFVGFCPDHGCHKDLFGGGAHKSRKAEDLNVTHYFGVVSSLKKDY